MLQLQPQSGDIVGVQEMAARVVQGSECVVRSDLVCSTGIQVMCIFKTC